VLGVEDADPDRPALGTDLNRDRQGLSMGPRGVTTLMVCGM